MKVYFKEQRTFEEAIFLTGFNNTHKYPNFVAYVFHMIIKFKLIIQFDPCIIAVTDLYKYYEENGLLFELK